MTEEKNKVRMVKRIGRRYEITDTRREGKKRAKTRDERGEEEQGKEKGNENKVGEYNEDESRGGKDREEMMR